MADDLLAGQRSIFSSGLSTAEKLVLLAILDHWSRENGTPYPAAGRLAVMTSMHPRAVLRTLRRLEGKLALVVNRQTGRRNTYDLGPVFRGQLPVTDGHTSPKVTRHQRTPDPSPTVTPPVTDGHAHLKEPRKEPTEGTKGERASKRTPAQRKPKWTRVPQPFQPTDEERELARAMGKNFDVELAKFLDHEFKTPKSDAHASFRNWLRNDFGNGKAASPRQPNYDVVREDQYT